MDRIVVAMSGGVDSSLIAAMAAKRHRNLTLFHSNTVGKWSEYAAARALPKRNFQETDFEGAGNLLGEGMKEYVVRSEACSDCPVCCCSVVEVEVGGAITNRNASDRILEVLWAMQVEAGEEPDEQRDDHHVDRINQ